MSAVTALSFAERASAFEDGLSMELIRRNAPAVFAQAAHERMSRRYTFIPTERVLSGLMNVGFVPVQVTQASTRQADREPYARHVVRLRRRFETIELKDSVPE